MSSIPTPLEIKLNSLINNPNMTNQMNQMMTTMFLISNNNMNRLLDRQEKQMQNQSKIIELLLEQNFRASNNGIEL